MAKRRRSRRRTTRYKWAGRSSRGGFERGWTPDLEHRTLKITTDPDDYLIGFDGLVTTPSAVKMAEREGYAPPGPGLLNQGEMNLLYMLRSTFKRIRSSTFHVAVTVRVEFDGPWGKSFDESCTARSIVESPMWFKAQEATRKRYFKEDLEQVQGSRYTDTDPYTDQRSFVERGQLDSRGYKRRREYRRRPTTPQRHSPPDLFWTIAYATWGAMDRCVGKLQRQGRTYLQRTGEFIRYFIEEIEVKQVIEE